jgi:hypothetical protein
MSNVFKRITNAVCKVIRRVDTPFVSHMRMRSILDSIGHSVSHAFKTRYYYLKEEDILSLIISHKYLKKRI